MIKLETYFTQEEVSCNCGCGQMKIHRALLERLNAARVIAGVPFIITSWNRCPAYNKRRDGADNSLHLSGNAVDIKIPNSEHGAKIVKAIFSAGFPYIRFYRYHVHVDIRGLGFFQYFTWGNYDNISK